MNRAWTAMSPELWHSTGFPMWLAIVAAVFFAIILLVSLLRTERSFANSALAVIAGLGVVVATIAAVEAGGNGGGAGDDRGMALVAPLPALACLDGLAGEVVETACEKAIFAGPDSTAAAVSYVASQISRLSAHGTVASAERNMTPELSALRRAIERDRFGIAAYVLASRDGCTLSGCAFFRSLTNTAQISVNMNEKLYEGMIGRYEPSWNAPVNAQVPVPPASASALPLPGTPPPNVPPGKPVSGDFPSAASIPPINIMTPEPPLSAPPKAPAEASAAPPHPAPAKKPAAQKPRVQAPVMLTPPQAAADR